MKDLYMERCLASVPLNVVVISIRVVFMYVTVVCDSCITACVVNNCYDYSKSAIGSL